MKAEDIEEKVMLLHANGLLPPLTSEQIVMIAGIIALPPSTYPVEFDHVPDLLKLADRLVPQDRSLLVSAVLEIYELRKANKAVEAERDEAREALKLAADQLGKVHDDTFKQCAGYGLVTSDGRDFSCLEINRCSDVAREVRPTLEKTNADNG